MDADYNNSALVLDKCPAAPMSLKQRAQRIGMEAHVLYFVFKDRRTPWYARLVAACSVGYFFSPIQLIPNFIPVIGFADDLLVLLLGVRLLRRIMPPELLAECRELAEMRGVARMDDSGSAVASKPTMGDRCHEKHSDSRAGKRQHAGAGQRHADSR